MNNIEALANMIGSNTIILNNSIGLIGEFKNKPSRVENEIVDGNKIMHIPSMFNMSITIGDVFRVVDSNACILIDEDVRISGIIRNGNDVKAYLFILDNVKAHDSFDEFFDAECECDAIVVYQDGKMYCNDIKDRSIKDKFIYDSSIEIKEVSNNTYMLGYRNHRYNSSVLDRKNNVYSFNELYMNL